MVLTFGAVVALPPGETHAVPGWRTLVVTKVVVAGAAQVGTSGAVVMGVACDAVFVPHDGVGGPVFVLRPILSDVQPPLRRQPRDQRLSCNKKSTIVSSSNSIKNSKNAQKTFRYTIEVIDNDSIYRPPFFKLFPLSTT